MTIKIFWLKRALLFVYDHWTAFLIATLILLCLALFYCGRDGGEFDKPLTNDELQNTIRTERETEANKLGIELNRSRDAVNRIGENIRRAEENANRAVRHRNVNGKDLDKMAEDYR